MKTSISRQRIIKDRVKLIHWLEKRIQKVVQFIGHGRREKKSLIHRTDKPDRNKSNEDLLVAVTDPRPLIKTRVFNALGSHQVLQVYQDRLGVRRELHRNHPFHLYHLRDRKAEVPLCLAF